MPKQPTTTTIRHTFGGGFASDFGFLADVAPDKTGMVTMPWLPKALNVLLRLDGSPRKVGGTERLNSVSLGAEIRGLYDYWRQGLDGGFHQSRVLHAGTSIYSDNADGDFQPIFTSIGGTGIPCYNQFDNLLILSDDSGITTPKSWDGSIAQELAGTPPLFSKSLTHKGRVFAWGVPGDPSGLYYSVEFDPQDWVGAGSGRIDISPGDGDEIVAAASHKNDLWLFKGPNKGSIHRLQGSSPTGGDGFALVPFISGLGAVSHNSLFRMRDDLGFMWSDGSLHSLAATAAYGDFNEASLTRPFNGYLRDHVRSYQLRTACSASLPSRGQVWTSIAVDSANSNNLILVNDFRFDPPRFTIIDAYTGPSCLATVRDANNGGQPIIMLGSSDGFVRKTDRANRQLDPESLGGGTAYSAQVLTPYMHYGVPERMKTLGPIGVDIEPTGEFEMTINWRRDGGLLQTAQIVQGGGDSLAPTGGTPFTLDTSTLGGGYQSQRWVDTIGGGDFRSIQYEFVQANANVDMDMHGFSATIQVGNDALEVV